MKTPSIICLYPPPPYKLSLKKVRDLSCLKINQITSKKYKLKDKFITTYKDYGIVAHVKRNCFYLGNRFESKNQNLGNTG